MKTKITTREKIFTVAGTTVVCTLISALLGKSYIAQTILTGLFFYLITAERPIILYAQIQTLPRDIIACQRFVSMTCLTMMWDKTNQTVASIFKKVAAEYPNKTAFIMDDKKITFKEMEDLSNRMGNYFKSKKYERNETVALFSDSRVEYCSMWLGLSKIGIVTALINTNLRLDALKHSIKVANSKSIIVGAELQEAFMEVMDDEEIKNMSIYVLNDNAEIKPLVPNAIDLLEELKTVSIDKLIFDINDNSPQDKLCFIYTSGTTGMPKAAIITNLRFMFIAMGSFKMLGITPEDVIYNSLPLYHTSGGMVGAGMVILKGSTMAIRKKFSASNFWTDCIKYNCTVAQYIGEICRFLLLTPPKPTDKLHSLRMLFGNGLRPQIWPQFVLRFGIPNIGEFYGATEGNSNIVNYDNTIGAVGFVPRVFKFLYPVTLAKCDEETGEPLRNSEGLCMETQPGEPGVFIGKINTKHASRSFAGYADKVASEKKVLRNVFKQGDLYFNSSDILVSDIFGYFYFKDRTGDTFRWRGENVAASEVEAVVSKIAGNTDCVVYGVEVPETEGKAGMAAIVDPEEKLNFVDLAAGIKGALPPYARPVFIRILPELPMTGTFKLQKRDLQLEGYDLTKITDPIYIVQNDGTYKRFTDKDFDDVKNGRARL
ncbi:unnamed protein product [Diamesa serratosioi]